VVRIFEDRDLVCVPEPAVAVTGVEIGHAEKEAAKPETAGTASAQTPDMAAAEAAFEAAVLPGMVEMEAGIVSSGVVAHPLAVAMDVGSLGMAFLIAEGGLCLGLTGCAMKSGRAMLGDVSAADGVAASAMSAVLRERR